MSELKITIDQLKNYLGTGLKLFRKDDWHADDWTKGVIGTLDQIYLPMGDHPWFYIGIKINEGSFSNSENNQFKPICYRLYDLDKFIPELGFVPLKRLLNNEPEKDDSIEIEFIEGRMPFQKRFRAFAWVDYPDGESRKEHLSDFFLNGNHEMVPFSWMQQLFQWHFWPFGDEYFEAGLVIDKLLYNSPPH